MSGSSVGARTGAEVQRHPCEVQTTCQPPSAWCKDPWPAVIRGISTDGLNLSLARRYESGSGLAIELPTEDGGTTTVLARVAHVEASSEEGWLLGCTFVSELSDDEVQLVLNPGYEATGRRRKCGTINGVLFQTRLNDEVLRWFVRRLDLSAQWPLSYGKIVSFRIGSEAESSVEMTIKKCQLLGSYWIVDCKFNHGLSDELLQAITAPACA